MRVIIADDHGIVREGLRLMLTDEPDVDIVGEASSGQALLALLEHTDADILLLDVRMPDVDGLEALEQLRVTNQQIKVIIVSMHREPAYVRRAIELGASGYILKNTTRNELLLALRMVDAGKGYIQGEVTAPLIEQLATPPAVDRTPTLTPRETEILRLIAQGLETKQIARRLAISETTVKTHVRGIFDRLDVTNRAQATATGLRTGLID